MSEHGGEGRSDRGGATLSVLVVDDSSMARMINSSILTSLNKNCFVDHKFNVQTAENGKEAVDLHHSGSSFDLILMDWQMPVMDGLEATKALRAMGVESVIVGVSSVEEEEAKKAFVAAGLDEFLAKPLQRERMMPVLQKVLANK